MGGKPLRKSFWMLRGAAAFSMRPRNERAQRKRVRFLTLARRGDDPALLVFASFVVAAAARSRVLAHGANDHLGISAILHHAERRLFRTRRRHLHWRGAALGHPVPRPARF